MRVTAAKAEFQLPPKSTWMSLREAMTALRGVSEVTERRMHFRAVFLHSGSGG